MTGLRSCRQRSVATPTPALPWTTFVPNASCLARNSSELNPSARLRWASNTSSGPSACHGNGSARGGFTLRTPVIAACATCPSAPRLAKTSSVDRLDHARIGGLSSHPRGRRVWSRLDEELIDVAPAPVLAPLEASHDRMPCLVEVLRRVPV